MYEILMDLDFSTTDDVFLCIYNPRKLSVTIYGVFLCKVYISYRTTVDFNRVFPHFLREFYFYGIWNVTSNWKRNHQGYRLLFVTIVIDVIYDFDVLWLYYALSWNCFSMIEVCEFNVVTICHLGSVETGFSWTFHGVFAMPSLNFSWNFPCFCAFGFFLQSFCFSIGFFCCS